MNTFTLAKLRCHWRETNRICAYNLLARSYFVQLDSISLNVQERNPNTATPTSRDFAGYYSSSLEPNQIPLLQFTQIRTLFPKNGVVQESR